MTELEKVPTPIELAARGLAKPIGAAGVGKSKKPATLFYVSPEGHDLMNAPQTRNGLAARAADEARRNANPD